MQNSSIKELDEISKRIEVISHKVRHLCSQNNPQEGLELSVELFEISSTLKKMHRILEDDGK